MAYWIHIVVICQTLTTAEGVLYVIDERLLSDEAASLCNLATPEIQYQTGVNTVSLDGTNLDIASGESVWSGYVQTHAAFLYEGCYDEGFVNSSVLYTDMSRDPGECYSRCKTDVIGMQNTSCHCNPKPRVAQSQATGCNIICSNPYGTICGGAKAISIYRKVLYPGSGSSLEKENCRAFYWENHIQHSYIWKYCYNRYHCICENDVLSSTEFKYTWYYDALRSWGAAAGWCLQEGKKPALESGFLKFNTNGRRTSWIGQIRSRVIGSDKDLNNQTLEWRRGLITKSGGIYWLQFNTNHTKLRSLCENVSTSAPSPDSTYYTMQSTDLLPTTTTTPRNGSEPKSYIVENPQFPIIAVYVAVSTVLVLAAVVVIVIFCKIRRNGRGNEERTTEVFYQNTDDGIAVDLGNRPQNQTIGHEAQLGGNSQQENQDLSHRNRVTSTHEYSTIGNVAHSDEEPTQDYQDLNPQYENPPTHEYSTIGHEEQLDDNPQHEYQDLNPRFRITSTHDYSTIVNAAHSDEEPSQDYQDLNLQYENSSTHEYSTIGK